MQPGADGSFRGGIAVRLIAIDQDKMLLRDRLPLFPEIQMYITLLNIHEQEAVEGTAPELIPGLIGEDTALQGIKEDLLCGFAGGINIIIRHWGDFRLDGFQSGTSCGKSGSEGMRIFE